MRTTRALRAVAALGAVVAGFSVIPGAPPAGALTGLPAGFADVPVASVAQPTSLTPLPDGRVLVTSKSGEIRTITGTTASAPLLTLPVCTQSERGLLGLAVDPANAGNLFAYYTADFGGGVCRNRVQQLALAGSTLTAGAVLLDNIPSQGGNHNGGDLHVGKDGYLYVGVGDSGCDPRSTGSCQDSNDAARDLSLLNGKILRVTLAGDPAPGNPFLAAPGSVSCKTSFAAPGQVCREIFSYGLRNPFRLGFDPNWPTTRFFINDVGGGAWEEIDDGASGADYGWNVREGPCAIGSTTNCGPAANVTNPVLAYSHAATGCESIVGGAFVPNGAWPGFDGAYLYGDFICGKIFTASAVCGSWTSSTLASGVGQIVELQFVGKDLWYTTISGQVRRIIPPPSPTGGAASRFVPVATPARKLDTRTGIGGPAGVVSAGGTRTVALSPEVPAGAVAAAVNVTIVGSTGPGYVTAWPADKPRPPTSTINTTRLGQIVPNTALVAISPSQQLNVFTETGGHLLVDVYGYFVTSGVTTSGRFQSLPPQRILDTRSGLGAPNAKVNGTVALQVTGQGGIPGSGVAAVAVVLTGTESTSTGFVSAWPTGLLQPNTSTLNLTGAGDTRANLVVVPVGAGGKVSLFSSQPTHLIADVAGWFTDAGAASSGSGLFVPITPARLHDSREVGRPLGVLPGGAGCTLGNGWAVPPTASAVAANLTAVNSASVAFLTAYPGGTGWPNSSNLNTTRPGDVVAAQAVTKLGGGQAVSYLASVPLSLIVDVTGWFT